MTFSPDDGNTGTDADAETAIENALGELIGRGYRFVHPRDEQGEILAVVGVRAHGSVIDVVRLEAEDDVSATRMPGDEADILRPETVLWRSAGPLATVIADLLALEDDEFSPMRAANAGCWVPGGAGRAKFLVASA